MGHAVTDSAPGTEAEMPHGIQSVLVVGAGAMGSGIAQVVAEAGVPVTLFDNAAPAITAGMSRVESAWSRAVEKGRRTSDEIDAFRSNLTPASTLEAAAAHADLVVEAIIEDPAVKRSVFSALDAATPAGAILASNTSSISITAIAAATNRPEQVIGLHFFNPVPVLPLVEVVRGLQTSDETTARAVSFAKALGKTPVLVNDAPGFVANRILLPMINEAIFTLSEGVTSAGSIDQVMKLGMAHPIGPLALADLIGLDVCLHILETLQADFGDPKYRPAPLLRQMVAAGQLGRKSGEGFFRYDR